jgi:hypothetical protein
VNIFVICLFLQKQHARFELNLLGKFSYSSGSSVYTAIMDEPCSFDAGDKKFVYKLLGRIYGKMREWEKNIKMALTKISLMTEVDKT